MLATFSICTRAKKKVIDLNQIRNQKKFRDSKPTKSTCLTAQQLHIVVLGSTVFLWKSVLQLQLQQWRYIVLTFATCTISVFH